MVTALNQAAAIRQNQQPLPVCQLALTPATYTAVWMCTRTKVHTQSGFLNLIFMNVAQLPLPEYCPLLEKAYVTLTLANKYRIPSTEKGNTFCLTFSSLP